MTITSYIVRNVFQTYDKQLVSSRKLARMRHVIQQSEARDAVTISREARRRQMVERIAKEIVDSLLVSDTENPMVKGIKQDLEKEFGEPFLFTYPPDEGELKIMRQTRFGPQEVTPVQRESILQKLWNITMKKVDKTML